MRFQPDVRAHDANHWNGTFDDWNNSKRSLADFRASDRLTPSRPAVKFG